MDFTDISQFYNSSYDGKPPKLTVWQYFLLLLTVLDYTFFQFSVNWKPTFYRSVYNASIRPAEQDESLRGEAHKNVMCSLPTVLPINLFYHNN